MNTLISEVMKANKLRARQQVVMNNSRLSYKMRLAAIITMDTRKGVNY